MTDLFSHAPHPRLHLALERIDRADPAAEVWCCMAEGFGFSRSGNADARTIAGFGVIGQGPTWDEAARQWIAGARRQLNPQPEEA